MPSLLCPFRLTTPRRPRAYKMQALCLGIRSGIIPQQYNSWRPSCLCLRPRRPDWRAWRSGRQVSQLRGRCWLQLVYSVRWSRLLASAKISWLKTSSGSLLLVGHPPAAARPQARKARTHSRREEEQTGALALLQQEPGEDIREAVEAPPWRRGRSWRWRRRRRRSRR